MSLSRRTVLRATVAGAALTALPPGVASASPPAEGTITDLGPASITNALGNAVFVDGLLYAVTRGLSPNAVGVYDPGADRVLRHYDIPTGIGSWAITAVGTDVYVGTHGPSDLYRINTVTHTVTNVASFGDHFIWNIAASPDGNPHLDILGHCTGRMVTRRPPGVTGPGDRGHRARSRPPSDFDAAAVFAACAEHGKAVEINSRPERLDPPKRLIRLALEAGCSFAIDTDAHAPGQLDWQRFGCERAALCGVPANRVVNTWPADRLVEWAGEHAR